MSTIKEIRQKRNRIRLFVIGYFAFMVTFSSPIVPLHSPSLENAEAEAVLEPREYARAFALAEYEWADKQFTCLNRLWGKESAWNPSADNPESSAFGIAQMLGEESKSPEIQIRNGLRYIEHRYGTPCDAWLFWQRNYWY